MRKRRARGASTDTRSRLSPARVVGGFLALIAGLAGCVVCGLIGASAPLLSR
ncbi:MAG: hypothetical protein JWM42_750 [Burkholderia sp.]|nr:hypothetical protein [Burkholderia sp.]